MQVINSCRVYGYLGGGACLGYVSVFFTASIFPFQQQGTFPFGGLLLRPKLKALQHGIYVSFK
jgi:hypothetical protein